MSPIVILVVLISSLAYILGGFLVLFQKNWSEKTLVSLMALSAGLLLSISLLDLMPDAQKDIRYSSLFVMIGFLVMYLVFLPAKLNDNSNGTVKGLTWGMLLHNFFEGLSIAFSYSGSIKLGVIVSIALVIHKIPEGLSYTSAMLAFLNGRKKTTIYLFIQGVFTWLGAGISVMLTELKNFQEPITAVGISVTAGIFLYLSGSVLLPFIHQKPFKRASVLFVCGIVLYFLLHTVSDALS